jgi:hypothetical protein
MTTFGIGQTSHAERVELGASRESWTLETKGWNADERGERPSAFHASALPTKVREMKKIPRNLFGSGGKKHRHRAARGEQLTEWCRGGARRRYVEA